MATFTVYISGEVVLDADDFGGEPGEITMAAQAAEAMRAYGPKLTTLREWALLDDVIVSVDHEDVW